MQEIVDKRNFRRRIVGAALSVIAFGGLFLFLDAFEVAENTLLKFLISAFVGSALWLGQELVSLRTDVTGQLHLDHDVLSQQIEANRRDMATRMDTLSRAARVYEAIASSAINDVSALALVDEMAKVKEGSSIRSVLYDKVVDDLLVWTSTLNSAQGDLVIDGEDDTLLLALTAVARTSIVCVSDYRIDGLGELAFWNSDLGRRYFEAQQAAIERHVKIERLFIVESPGSSASVGGGTGAPDPSSLMLALLERQRASGIDCRVIYRSKDLPSALVDSVLFDDEVLYQSLAAGSDGPSPPFGNIQKTHVTRNPGKVHNFQTAIGKVWPTAETLTNA